MSGEHENPRGKQEVRDGAKLVTSFEDVNKYIENLGAECPLLT